MKQLKIYEVSEDIFNQILLDYEARVIEVDNIYEYFYGYTYCPDPTLRKSTIVCGSIGIDDYLIMQEYKLASYDKNIITTEWKQVRVHCNRDQNTSITCQSPYSGIHCWNYVMKIIKKHYTEEEIDSCFNAHIAQYDDDKKQIHIFYQAKVKNLIYELKDCYKYDINGAHCDALSIIFLRCREDFVKIQKKRKEKGHEKLKNLFNFFVGEMCRKGHRLTYNWIVQRVTDKVREVMKYCGGEIIYSNTDSICVRNANNLLEHSTELGEFKLEYSGTVYFLRTDSYTLYQFGKDLVGSCIKSVRDRIDLSKGKAVLYNKRIVKEGFTRKTILTNVEETTLLIEEII